MTMGWHMIMEFEPSLVGCYIWSENHSRELVHKSRECVINVPTVDMAAKSGRDRQLFGPR
jgi:flavin reductase (DIM6/NTAB) family NADH-FMN oxidoreductase RutF